ncbi:disease resistance protein Pik-2-like [Miscanthus floridulus]|uniref:disease resistance protein Pik-2-like n=1 Tax=Miscanthus floridulus TaxID=154761 RepID=UPI00345B2B66
MARPSPPTPAHGSESDRPWPRLRRPRPRVRPPPCVRLLLAHTREGHGVSAVQSGASSSGRRECSTEWSEFARWFETGFISPPVFSFRNEPASIRFISLEINQRTGRLSDNFMGTLERDPEFHGLRPLFSWMHCCVDACSDSIKQCVFYLSIFPPEKNIRLRRLLWRWIAEGYCRDTSDGRTSEEIGGKFISELVNWINILQSSSNKGLCQIDGFFHEYISQRMEDNRVFALEGHCSLNSQRGGQHLTIRSSWDRNEIVYESIDFSRLRSLTVFGEWKSFFISNKKVNMRLLRVLDLEDAKDVKDEHLERIAKLLTLDVKFLSLRGCRDITRLPSSTGGLRQLQTMDVRHTRVVTLPPVITKLQKLRYTRAGTTTEAWDWEGDVLLLPADGQVKPRRQ